MSLFRKAPDGRTLLRLPPSSIRPNPFQPRRIFDPDSLASLAESIRRYGVISPLCVRRDPSQTGYELVAGERRLRAAMLAGLSEVPCVLIEAGDKRSAELAMVENRERCDLSMFEEAEAIRQLLVTGGCTQTELAARLSLSQPGLANKLRLLRFDDEQRQLILKGHLSEKTARAFLRLPPEKRSECLRHAVEHGMAGGEAESYIDSVICGDSVSALLAEKKKAPRRKPPCREAPTAEPTPPVSEKNEAVSPPGKPPQPIRTVVIGDLSLFYNTLERCLSLLRQAGYEAGMDKVESDGGVKVTLSIREKP